MNKCIFLSIFLYSRHFLHIYKLRKKKTDIFLALLMNTKSICAIKVVGYRVMANCPLVGPGPVGGGTLRGGLSKKS